MIWILDLQKSPIPIFVIRIHTVLSKSVKIMLSFLKLVHNLKSSGSRSERRNFGYLILIICSFSALSFWRPDPARKVTTSYCRSANQARPDVDARQTVEQNEESAKQQQPRKEKVSSGGKFQRSSKSQQSVGWEGNTNKLNFAFKKV